MISYLFILGVVLLPASLSLLVADKKDVLFLPILLGASGIFFLGVLWMVNDAIPFNGGGDDNDYFDASVVTFHSLPDWFDFRQFAQTHVQAGYPLLLAWVHQFTGGSLFHRKALNVFFFLLLAIIWYAIGKKISGQKLAVVYAAGILMATPLWYYWMFLLKDMTIVILQSVFILGLVYFLSPKMRGRGYGLIVLSTVLIIPFRSPMALLNLAAMGGAVFMRTEVRQTKNWRMWKMLFFGLIVVVVLFVGHDPVLLQDLGVMGMDRSLDPASVQATLQFHERARPAYFANPLKFIPVYLVGEVAAFNPKTWENMTSYLIRPVLMVPWIYIGLPLFIAGVGLIFRNKNANNIKEHASAKIISATNSKNNIPANEFTLLLLMMVLIYAGVSWLSSDTTRWRMSSFPPMIAIAGIALMKLGNHKLVGLLLGWGLFISFSLLIYYALFK